MGRVCLSSPMASGGTLAARWPRKPSWLRRHSAGGAVARELLESAPAIASATESETEAGSETQAETDSEPLKSKCTLSDQSPEEFLKFLVRECHSAVRGAGWEQGLDPHSTIAALLLQDGQAISIHAGDSRVMQYSEKAFVDRTLDHSVAQLHALRGSITDEEIADHPDQNRLFAQVGGPMATEAEIKHWDLDAGRRFVLCSDGFWEIFRHDEIIELFASDDPEAEMQRPFRDQAQAAQAPRQHNRDSGGSDSRETELGRDDSRRGIAR